MKKAAILIVLILAVFAGLFAWWNYGLGAFDKNNKAQKVFVVQKGQGLKEISQNLKKENLIRDQIVFFLYVKKQWLDNQIQAGDFRLSPSMNTAEIASNLTHGTIDIWVTIPEGKRAEEVAEILKDQIPTYQMSWISILKENEGYLFPDTYLIPKDTDINLIVSIMRNNFEKKFADLTLADKNFSKNQIVIIASLVEREAKETVDRPLIASVIYNRLNIGMKLDIDATVQYLLGYQEDQKRWWKKNLTMADLRLDSPFNTYRNAGLPPAPIANPGLDSLKAAGNPASTNYFYYLADKSGKNHYAKTLEEQNANIKKYGL